MAPKVMTALNRWCELDRHISFFCSLVVICAFIYLENGLYNITTSKDM